MEGILNTHCPCCGIYDYEQEIGGTYFICPVCDWEDDLVQLNNPDYTGGANVLSLNQKREMFKKNQTCADNHIIFISKPSDFEGRNSFVAHIPKIDGVEHLFDELSEKLQFPNYFGRNWNALNDFMWIDQKDIVIVHDSFITLNENDFHVYIEILHSAVLSWSSDPEHTLRVIFRKNYKEISERFIKK